MRKALLFATALTMLGTALPAQADNIYTPKKGTVAIQRGQTVPTRNNKHAAWSGKNTQANMLVPAKQHQYRQ